MSQRLLIVLGTRPEAIKLAPVIAACRRRPSLEPLICSTGQHRELLEPLLTWFDIRPEIDLRLMQSDQSLATLTGRCVKAVDEVIREQQPAAVIVQGDTASVMAASIAGFLNRCPVVHVEAGLRTGKLESPWPEEFNRRITTLAARLHCAPTTQAAEQLLREGVDPRRVIVTGNTVIDALEWTAARLARDDRAWRDQYAIWGARRVVLITAHRREIHGAGLEQICLAVVELARRFTDVQFVWPVHLNPQVWGIVHERLASIPNVTLIAPVDYPEFVWLMQRSTLIISDSGGVQEEAPSLRRPVLVMRDTTERPEGVACGAVELVGTRCERIVDRTTNLLTDPAEYAQRQVEHNPYGDGHAAERIVTALETMLDNCR